MSRILSLRLIHAMHALTSNIDDHWPWCTYWVWDQSLTAADLGNNNEVMMLKVPWIRSSRDNMTSRFRYHLTRAPLHWGGGGLFRAPLSFSCDIFSTNPGITTKPAVPFLPTILHIVLKFHSPGNHSSATNDVRVTSCSADFDQK